MRSKILIVDDEQSLLEMMTLLLGRRGYQVRCASNGRIGLKLIKQQKPDLILMDVLMPEMDGLHFFQELKQNQQTADIPVLVMTGRVLMEDSFKALGVEDF